MTLAGLPAWMDSAPLELKRGTEDAILVMKVLLLLQGSPARNVHLEHIQRRATAAAWNALQELFPILKGLQRVMHVLQENTKSNVNRALTAPLEHFHLLETVHVPNAQLAQWRQSKVAAHVLFAHEANILRREVRDATHVLEARFLNQAVEIAARVMQVVFPKIC